jgi:predicted dehydrogenase
MAKDLNRLQFIKALSLAGAGLTFGSPALLALNKNQLAGKRVGIIGLDTSHSTAFTKALNAADALPQFGGYKVVAAYPRGSNDIVSSVSRIAGYTEEVKKMGVEIVDSINALLQKSDVILLETNDGRLHLQQAIEVVKAGKRFFIDKPLAASLADAIAIFDAAEKNKVPVFSSSSLRFMGSLQEVVKGKSGKVLGADTYSPATLEKTHPDLFWYGIHGVEMLYALMGTGCKEVSRTYTLNTDLVTGVWEDGRIGSFRGTRSGTHGYGGIAYCEKGNVSLGPYDGYNPLLTEIIRFFETGIPPVQPAETLEMFAFMEAADVSKKKGGAAVNIKRIMENASKRSRRV